VTGLLFPLGAKPDRADPRDYQFRTLAGTGLAKAATLVDRKFYTMVNPDFRISQGNEGTCVAHASTNVLLAGPSAHPTYPAFQTEELAHQFARQLYLEASGDTTYQQGMYPRDAAAKLLESGLIESYWKVPQVEDVITALLTFGPVKIAIPWYSSMFYNDGRLSKLHGNFYIKVNLESEHVGYHDIALTGIDLAPDDGGPQFFRVQNSWSGWGANGTARLTVEGFRRLNAYDNWTFAEKSF
jgi:hypothetical protein